MILVQFHKVSNKIIFLNTLLSFEIHRNMLKLLFYVRKLISSRGTKLYYCVASEFSN